MTAQTSAPVEGAPLIRPSTTDHPLYEPIVEACRTVFDPEIPGRIDVTTANGPYRSVDGGRTWSPLPGSAGAPEMTNLLHLGDGRLLAGSSHSGVLEYREVEAAAGRPPAVD